MARPYRLQAPHTVYHITSRGDDRKKIYKSDRDHSKFLEYILSAKEKHKFYLYGYVLMSNHYHLLLETTEANLSKIMHSINSSYTTYYNIKRKKSGHLFQGRYKSIIVDKDEYLLELTRYMHLNPVKAKIVELPGEYKYSSYKVYIDNKREDIYIDKPELKKILSMSAKRYEEFVLEGIKNKAKNPLENIYGGFILGRADFIRDTINKLREQVESKDISYKREINKGIEIEEVVRGVAREYNEKEEEIYKGKKKPVLARKVAIYLAKRLTQLQNREIGDEFGISYSAVSKAAGNIEKLMEKDKRMKKKVGQLISHFKG